VGFYDVRRRAIACLRAHAFDSVIRGAMPDNNLLATGEVSVDDVVRMIGLCRGTQYSAKPMTEDPNTLKHEMKPHVAGEQWFIRFYFIRRPDEVVMFISVPQSKYGLQ
jgi:hypothetical protein